MKSGVHCDLVKYYTFLIMT